MTGNDLEIAASHFRVLLHRMLEPKPSRFHISAGEDDWGVVVTRKAITGVQVWYSARKGLLTLGITSEEMRNKIPEASVPEGAESDPSKSGWRQFRWTVPVLDLTKPPQSQPGAEELKDRILEAFDWIKNARTDLKG